MYKIGQKVVVTNRGQCFTSYDDWADIHSLENYVHSCADDTGFEYTVSARGYHGSERKEVIYGITGNGKSFIIGGMGLKPAPEYEWQWLLMADNQMTSLKFNISGYHRNIDEVQDEWRGSYWDAWKRIEESKREVKS